MVKKISLLFLLLFGLCDYVSASCSENSCTSEIAQIYVSGTSDGKIYFDPKDDPTGVVNCTLYNNQYFTLKKDHPLFD